MPERFKAGEFTFEPGQPIVIKDEPVGRRGRRARPQKQRQQDAQRAAAFIRDYIKAGRELLNGTYAAVRDLAPAHFISPARVFVFSCDDGVLVRYEQAADEPTVFAAVASASLHELSPGASDHVLVCLTEADQQPDGASSQAPTSILGSQSAETGARSTHLSFQVELVCRIAHVAAEDSAATDTPFRHIAVENDFEFDLQGLVVDADTGDPRHQFVATSRVTLPVGWQRIEIYVAAERSDWGAQDARALAERDILSYVMRRQFRAQQFRKLDPNVDARRVWASLFDEYQALLDSDPPEEELQQFLRQHPLLLSATQTKLWPKLPLGARITDFVFREADGEYLLVELERPSLRLFRKNGDTAADLNHARDQVTDWRRYLEDNLSTAQRELGLTGISTNPKSLIVIGRSRSLTASTRRKLTTMQSEQPRTKIATYDDVLENAKATIENILGPLWTAGGTADVYVFPVGGSPDSTDASV